MKRLALLLIATLLLLLCVSCNQDKVTKEQYYGMYSHLSQVWAQSLLHTDAKVAFYGDSRVIGADWNAAYPDSKVVNLGVGGDRISNLLTRMPQIRNLTENGQLECVFLAIGGNDCMSGSYDSTVFRTEYDRLLAELEELGLTVYVNTVAGITDEGSAVSSKTVKAIKTGSCSITAKTVNGRMKEANVMIKELAQARSMTVIDMAELMNDSDGKLKSAYASPDGVHFSAAGNQLWFDTLRPYVQLYD